MTKLPDYYVHVACPVKTSIWLPQKRDRLIIIGSRRSFAWSEPAAEGVVTLKEILEPEPKPHIPDYVGRRLAASIVIVRLSALSAFIPNPRRLIETSAARHSYEQIDESDRLPQERFG